MPKSKLLTPVTHIENAQNFKYLLLKIKPLLEKIYRDKQTVQQLLEEIFSLLQDQLSPIPTENLNKWSQNEVIMITYSDSICTSEEKPLVTLNNFLEHLQDTITGVHILPFCPYSSDDGFAVIDYLQVDSKLGDWEDVEAIAQKVPMKLIYLCLMPSRELLKEKMKAS